MVQLICSQGENSVNYFPPLLRFSAAGPMLGFHSSTFTHTNMVSWKKRPSLTASFRRLRVDAVRREATPFPPIRLCSISSTSERMMFDPGRLRLVSAGSVASSLEENFMTFCIYIDVSEWTNSTLLLSDCFSALKKFDLHLNRCHTKRYILQIPRCGQDIQNASLG